MNSLLKRRAIRNQRNFNRCEVYSDDSIHDIRLKNDDDDMILNDDDLEFSTSDECSECEELLDMDEVSSDLVENDSLPIKKKKFTKIRDRERQNQTGRNTFKYLFILIFIVVVLIIYFCTFVIKKDLDCDEIPSCSFQNRYIQLQDEFQNQNKMSWKVIRTAINSIINPIKHDQPAVILLVASKRAGEISSCLANSLANALEESYNNVNGYLRLHKVEGITDTEMKEKIDTAFKESFEKNNRHVIVVERLDTFAAETAMILHSYCDHENAPYKDVVVLMTVTTNVSLTDSNLTLKKMDRIAWQHLDNTWEMQLHEEKRAALLSRITTSVALIFPEDTVPPSCSKFTNI